ncbi:MAG: MFS transporter [Puniceicoccales bacterium]|nr:MFS transporter [Puniceicoccales bacterium]
MTTGYTITACLSFYILSALTNVMVLGALTESWLQYFQWKREALSQIYCCATLCVAITAGFSGVCFEKLRLKKAYLYSSLCLGNILLLISFLPPGSPNPLCFTLLLFSLQWLGQGLLVVACRTSLMACVPRSRRGIFAGIQESLGTLAVSILPFIVLKMIYLFTWQTVLRIESFMYFFAALSSLAISSVPPNRFPKQRMHTPWFLLKTKKFWLVNGIINLPILLSSGYFFHLEALCHRWHIRMHQLQSLLIPQVLGIICVHLLLGIWVTRKSWKLTPLLVLLMGSQCMCYVGLLHLSIPLGKYAYVVGNALGWGFFGVLINISWEYLYGAPYRDFCLGWAVCLGFIFNALGPLLFSLIV